MKNAICLMIATLIICAALSSCGNGETQSGMQSGADTVSVHAVTDSQAAADSFSETKSAENEFTVGGEIVSLPLPKETRISRIDVDISIEIPDGVTTADLTALSEMTGVMRLTVVCKYPLDALILPSSTVEADVEAVDTALLDISAATELSTLVIDGVVRGATCCPSPLSLSLNGTSPSAFAECVTVRRISLFSVCDLSALTSFPALDDLYLSRPADGGTWDLSPVAALSLETLRLAGTLTQDELSALAGAYVETLQADDRGIGDLSVISKMPALKSLMLTVSSDQPPLIVAHSLDKPYSADDAALIVTPIPTNQLTDFAKKGELYIFPDPNR